MYYDNISTTPDLSFKFENFRYIIKNIQIHTFLNSSTMQNRVYYERSNNKSAGYTNMCSVLHKRVTKWQDLKFVRHHAVLATDFTGLVIKIPVRATQNQSGKIVLNLVKMPN